MALTVANKTAHAEDVWGRHRVRPVDVTFDSSYPRGGEDFAPSDVGLHEIEAVIAGQGDVGHKIEWDAANEKLRVLVFPEVQATVKLTDDDSATTNGTDVYVVVDDPTLGTAHLESVNANNADATVELSDGTTLTIQDDDSAATNGVALNADEDNSESVLQADLSGIAEGRDVYVRTDENKWFRIRNASSGGVGVHFDDDGSTATDRLLFVSPTDSDVAAVSLDAEIEPTTDLSNVTATLLVLGR